MWGNLIDLIYPALCQICGIKTSYWNQNICKSCIGKIKQRIPPFCIKCGRQISNAFEPENTCRDCKSSPPYFDRAISVFYYDGFVKELVHNFKYKKMTSLIKEFEKFIIDFMNKYGMGKNINLILSIPMHQAKLLKRDINPSHILAKQVAKRLGIRYSGRLLKKVRNTPPQSKLRRQDRIKNIKNSFVLDKNRSCDVRNSNILIVDDLFTTGSTVNECARILKEGRSNSVEVVTLARGDDSYCQ